MRQCKIMAQLKSFHTGRRKNERKKERNNETMQDHGSTEIF